MVRNEERKVGKGRAERRRGETEVFDLNRDTNHHLQL